MDCSEVSKKIVFINQATGYITIDIVNSFARNRYEVSLIAGSIRVQDIDLDASIKWSKIVKYNRGNPIAKFISWIIGTLQIFFLLILKYRKHEVFYITIPPFAYLLSLLLARKSSILVFDVYPDVLKIYGIKSRRLIFKIWSRLNQKAFNRAHRIYTIGNGLANLLEQYVKKEKIIIVPLWTGLTRAVYIPKCNNPWRKALNLQNKFLLIYSGNIGVTHNVEVLIELANLIRNEERFHFIIIGRGERVNKIESMVEEYKLPNCTLLPFQSDESLIHSLAAADIGVVTLDERVADVSLPSKIYNLQALGIPILGISPMSSELSIHLKKYKNGFCFSQDQLTEMIQCITILDSNEDLYHTMVKNSLNAASNFTSRNAEIFHTLY